MPLFHHGTSSPKKDKSRKQGKFANNDEPTPRTVPASAEDERASLRAQAAAGAGLPGYMTKQEQSVRGSAIDISDGGGGGGNSSSSGGGGSSSSSADEDGGSGPGGDKALALNDELEPSDGGSRGEPPSAAELVPAGAPGGSAKGSGRGLGESSLLRQQQQQGMISKPSEHENGLWAGFMSIFRFERREQKRASLSGAGSGLDLGDARALPPSLDLSGSGGSELLKGKVLTEGRRSSRSHSVLSPRGSTPTSGAGSTSGETEDEERMRTYLQLDHSTESDFNNSNRRASSTEGDGGSGGGGGGGSRSSSSGGKKSVQLSSDALAAAVSGGGGGGGRRKSDGVVEMPSAAAASSSAGGAAGGSGSDRRSVGGTPIALSESEATVSRKTHEIQDPQQRGDAQERVFGDRRKSKISASQLRGIEDESGGGGGGGGGGGHGGKTAQGVLEGVGNLTKEQLEQREAAAWQLHKQKADQFERDLSEWFGRMRASKVESKYSGVKISNFPPSLDDIKNLLGAYTRSEPQPLHQRYLYELLLNVYRQWENPPPGFVGQTARSVVDLEEPPEGSRLLVVGDTHGQLADVLWIFAEYGLPSKTNKYLFNGDVADRGSHAVEIFVLLFSFMLYCPGSVYLSRGNHENCEINERAQHYGGGFAEEVRSKYEPQVFELFSSLFELLPLAFVIAQKALVIHGGLWRHRGVTLSQLRKLSHRRQCPEAPQTYDDYIFFDLLWSDPHPEDGDGVHESSRGDGCILFGRDMTVEFLRRNSLQLIIRSHQLPSDGHGYEVLHDGRCITVFSASNYGGSCYNAGAILVWEGGEIDAHEFIAPNLEAQQKAYGGDGYEALLRRFSSRGTEWEEEVGCAAEPPHVARLDGEIVRMIKERVCRHRHELASTFAKLDKQKEGFLSVELWAKAMGDVLSLDVPWAKYRPWLAELNDSSQIHYATFLGRFEVRLKEQYAGWQRTVLQMFYNSLLAADLQITELLGFFDRDGDGEVSLSECTKALSALELGLSPQQVQQLVLILGFDPSPTGKVAMLSSSGGGGHGNGSGHGGNGDGEPRVDLEQFLKRLALVADHTVIARSEQELLDLQQIAKWIEGVARRSGKTLSQLFMGWDDNSDGYIDYEEFVTCCFTCQEQLYLADPTSLDYIYTREEFDELARTVDQAKTGRINYLSFLGLFSSAESASVAGQQQQEGNGGGGGKEGTASSPLLSRVATTTTASVFIEHICATLWSNDVILSKALRSHDSKATGAVTPSQFAKALEKMNESLAQPFTPLTPPQIQGIVGSLPLDPEGRINYKEFMNAFEVRDKYQEA